MTTSGDYECIDSFHISASTYVHPQTVMRLKNCLCKGARLNTRVP